MNAEHKRKRRPEPDMWLSLIILALLPAALFINLGLNPLFAVNDEAIRILVAQEMFLSGDFITPTTLGEPYLNKPPLFNWLIILSAKFSGGFDELSLRIVSVLSLLAFAYLVYHYASRHYSRSKAFILALCLVTSGRILFFDSFLGLIDIAHGAVIFWSFMLIYHSYKRKRYWALFIGSYLLTTVAFFLKGMPALVFQGITIITLFAYHKDLKRLISVQHLFGILLLLILAGTYYYAYSLRNDLNIREMFAVLLDQSTQRTGMKQGFSRTIGHITAFPFELLYHFAPWTIFGIALIRKNSSRDLLQNGLLKYVSYIFLANIVVYWLSPGIFARYLFMMVPLIYLVFLYLYWVEEGPPASWRKRIIDTVLLFIGLVPTVIIPVLFFTGLSNEVPSILLWVVWVVFVFISFLMFRMPTHRMLLAITAILCIRIVFNLTVLPARAEGEQRYLAGVRGVVENTKGYSLYIYKNNYLVQEADAFYINQGRGDLLQRKYNGFTSQELLLVDDRQYDPSLFEEIYVYACKWYDRPQRVCRLKDAGDVVP